MSIQYISFKKKNLKEESFQNIRRNDDFLQYYPSGGLCATLFDLDNKKLIEWLKKNLGIQKKVKKVPSIIFKLKDSTKIINIQNLEQLEELIKNYPLNGTLDFETLAYDYDGIFFNYDQIPYHPLTRSYGINTLHLFNLKCIENYQNVIFELGEQLSIKRIFPPQKISKPKEAYYIFKEYAINYFWEYLSDWEDELQQYSYEKFLEIIEKIRLNICIKIIFSFDTEFINLIKAYGFKEAYFIVIAVISNLLRFYYEINKSNIKKLKMSFHSNFL